MTLYKSHRDFRFARNEETQMKTLQFLENFDLCHPQLGRSETLTNLTSNIISSEIDLSNDSIKSLKSTKIKHSAPFTSSSVTYGRSSSNQQPPSNQGKTASDLLSTGQEGQRQQESNKKRKREAGR